MKKISKIFVDKDANRKHLCNQHIEKMKSSNGADKENRCKEKTDEKRDKFAILKHRRKPLEDIKVKDNDVTFRKCKRMSDAFDLPTIVEETPSDLMQHITMIRDYDTLNMNDISVNYFSDESFLFEDVTDEIQKTNFADMQTPSNFQIPYQINAIKAIRKNIKSSDPITTKSHLEDDEELYKNVVKKEYGEFNCNLLGIVNLDEKENFVLHSVLYTKQYLTDIIDYQLKREKDYSLSNGFLKNFPITSLNRAIVINWLIKLQAYMRTEHVLTYTTVKMMDKALDVLNIELHELQLVALASFWLSLKFHSMYYKDASWMIKQSNGAYTVHQLIEMERKVFQANDFHIYSINPSTFIHYYLFYLQIPNSDIIAHVCHYMLDCISLDCRFVRTLPSQIASVAIFTTLHLMKQYNEKLWLNLSIYKEFYRPQDLNPMKSTLIDILKEMNDPSFQCREPFNKFSSNRYMNVTSIINDALSQNK